VFMFEKRHQCIFEPRDSPLAPDCFFSGTPPPLFASFLGNPPESHFGPPAPFLGPAPFLPPPPGSHFEPPAPFPAPPDSISGPTAPLGSQRRRHGHGLLLRAVR